MDVTSPGGAPAPSAASNLKTRAITGFIGAPLILLLVFAGPAWGFFALIFAATAVGAREMFAMTHAGDRVAQAVGVALTLAASLVLWFFERDARALLALFALLPVAAILLALVRLGDVRTAAMRLAATVFGPIWVGLLTTLPLLRRGDEAHGAGWVVLALTSAWLADTAGYFAGRFLGKHKLYEAVSPKKTIEGFVGAVLGAALGAVVAHFWYLPTLPLVPGVALALVAGALGQLGDLGESLLKRSVGVKDSGGIVPGHGGILDRIDALLVTSTLVYLWTRFAL